MTDIESLRDNVTQLYTKLNALAHLLRTSDLIHGYVAKLPVADRTDDDNHEPVKAMMAEQEFYSDQAMQEAIKAISPQEHVMGKSGRAGRRWVGIVHIDDNPEVIDAILEVNALKQQLSDDVLYVDDTIKRTPKARRVLWRKILPQGVIPLTVTRQIVLATDIKSFSLHWMDKGIASESVNEVQANAIIAHYADLRAFLFEEERERYVNRKKALIAEAATKNTLRIVRPIKLYPCYKFNQRVHHAHTPLLVVQSSSLIRYPTLKPYRLDNEADTLLSRRYDPIAPEVHLYRER
ncbi:DNA replication terminus site-binding protein [Photobacterium sp. GB-72]|uniref:DNA replication terminus site-binding protein n=1 Tax=Photobacterium sp. GB-72 TaxID=2022105 RepID=UPI001304B2D3|nr:DNA replication terminus site-binding protein [Photobacterium sp. GB-72]